MLKVHTRAFVLLLAPVLLASCGTDAVGPDRAALDTLARPALGHGFGSGSVAPVDTTNAAASTTDSGVTTADDANERGGHGFGSGS